MVNDGKCIENNRETARLQRKYQALNWIFFFFLCFIIGNMFERLFFTAHLCKGSEM